MQNPIKVGEKVAKAFQCCLMCVTIRAIKEQAAVSKSQPVSQSPPNNHKSREGNDGSLKWCFNLCYLCVSFFFFTVFGLLSTRCYTYHQEAQNLGIDG